MYYSPYHSWFHCSLCLSAHACTCTHMNTHARTHHGWMQLSTTSCMHAFHPSQCSTWWQFFLWKEVSSAVWVLLYLCSFFTLCWCNCMVHICRVTGCDNVILAKRTHSNNSTIFTTFPVSSSNVNVRIDPENTTITEGDPVNITLVADSIGMVNFSVTLQDIDGTAMGESSQIHPLYKIAAKMACGCSFLASYWNLPYPSLTADVDYVAGPYTVIFSAVQMSATVMVLTIDDNITELSEDFIVMITFIDGPSVEIGSPNVSLITIEDNDPGEVYIVVHKVTNELHTWHMYKCTGIQVSNIMPYAKMKFIHGCLQSCSSRICRAGRTQNKTCSVFCLFYKAHGLQVAHQLYTACLPRTWKNIKWHTLSHRMSNYSM